MSDASVSNESIDENKSWEDCEVNCIFDLDWNSNTVKFVDD